VISALRRDYFSAKGKRVLTISSSSTPPPIRAIPAAPWSPRTASRRHRDRHPQSDEQRVFIGIGFAVPIENAAAAAASPFLMPAIPTEATTHERHGSKPQRSDPADGAHPLRGEAGRRRQDHFLERVLVPSWRRGICWSRAFPASPRR